MTTVKELPEQDWFTSGHTACAGCGGAVVGRIAMKVFGPRTVVYHPASCMLIFTATYPHNAFRVPYLHVLFENSAVCAAGIKRALKRLGKDDVNVVAFVGDGGTADIGIQALSGAAERNEDIIYIMYDNEAYMNTGIQRSGSTPFGAWTTTTPVGSVKAGKVEFKKDVPSIMMAHDVPYVATASIAYPTDFIKKLEKARDKKGFRYIQVIAPCPTGWKAETDKTIELARLAVETGIWTLFEYEDGKYNINRTPKFSPVEDYLNVQGRFKHLTPDDIVKIQDWVKRKWARDKALEQVYK